MSYGRSMLWMVRQFGLWRTIRYERARRSGMTLDYGRAFTADELARIGEHSSPAPWERAR